MPVDALLFDKDGTLFDFAETWNRWTGRMLDLLSEGDAGRLQAMAAAIDFDLATGKILPSSLVIASTNRQVAEALAPHVPQMDLDQLELYMAESAGEADLAEAVPLAAFLDELLARGKVLGVMTNDAEHSAKSQLSRSGVLDRFAFVAGFDSGHGAKPDADPLLAFCAATGIAPERTAMVGDSLHDLEAGSAAGMHRIGVLTGLAEAEELETHADVVLPDIGHIPGWLDR
ncbi:HAD family hydrolase [Phaeobacter gallaeciensis]|uniref:phosphoglycolate phosphatase n=1 Tax=Phaeobacter gallaeciensis TaxID=60890 RepID=A0AAD0EDK5_9RHOB|nr:HAD family hydrolase [Phaeobacter gallaeciensis]AHD10371.1 haloacid dehalogenase superfamily, subfamily IA [Phaeobacter gallaeciensis DSM 26640]ATE93635.1 hydrolase, HAD-superfamily [Phaeobacter gallaeciensis]ATE96544.1 hydrolase, HAD-superfamily [Phaeobacter gallaeciensis]ATF02299.1 hydrolase, HAD-superfamily [Phaeobacter gallaeciensis]ATF06679.1 hydrolase, HAD-superfamily [Phaeobacter gallaeciensis]